MAAKPCGARRHDGQTCRQPGTGTNGRCRFHGGASPPPGPGHPSWKDGKTSKFVKALPKHLRESFLASVQDKDILSVRNELGLYDARVMELLDRINTGESKDVINDAITLVHKIRGALKKDDLDVDLIDSTTLEILDLLNARITDDTNWATIAEAVETRRKLSDTERKLLELRQAVVDSKQLRAIMMLILQSIANHVAPLEGGRAAVDAVRNDLAGLMH